MLKNTLSPWNRMLLLAVLFTTTTALSAQVGVRHLEYTDVTSVAKGKVKDVHAFDQPLQVTIELDGLVLDVPDTGTVLTFDFETDWREDDEHIYSMGLVDPTGWQWVAVFDTRNGSLVLSDGTKWEYRYTVAALTEKLP